MGGSTDQPRPKRILALDGGGIRGVISISILARIESMFRERTGNPDLVLADEFDLFAGTSTGSIIATLLAWGMDTRSIFDLYRDHGPTMFKPTPIWQRFRARYRAESIARIFRQILVDDKGIPALLGTDKLRTRLLVVMRNATTGSAWPLTNNPDAMYNDPDIPGCNLELPLWQILRASTAAPTFFPPEEIDFEGERFTFIDGAITPYNNPALIALLTATLPEYRMGWEAGESRITLVSVGTGASRSSIATKPIARLNLIDHLSYLPPAMIGSIGEHQDLMCRVLGRCTHGHPIDSELGALRGAGPLDGARLCTYARYNPAIDPSIGIDDVGIIEDLAELGRVYADETIEPGQIP